MAQNLSEKANVFPRFPDSHSSEVQCYDIEGKANLFTLAVWLGFDCA